MGEEIGHRARRWDSAGLLPHELSGWMRICAEQPFIILTVCLILTNA